MTSEIFIQNISCLVNTEKVAADYVAGKKMSVLTNISNAFLFLKDGLIAGFGPMNKAELFKRSNVSDSCKLLDASGCHVMPSFCDSHTHLVFAGSRETEFTDRIKGLSYEEIAKRGGGILNSAKHLHDTSEDELFQQSMARVEEIIRLGTGAVEIKSGYGLNLEDELKMLRVIKRISDASPLKVKATFLGAHAVPAAFKNHRVKYVDYVINEMIPVVASYDLAEYIDVFCDNGFFTTSDTERILMAGIKYGFIPKIHANELSYSGGIQTGVKYHALSVDHLECTGDEEIAVLLNSETMPTLLPGSAFFLGLENPPARKMIDSGLPVALASDFNPGSSPSGNMKMILSLACIRLKMLPEEAINAATINSAYAMGISGTHGSICPGKVANVFITKKIPSLGFLPYAFGSDLIETVILNGRIIN